MCRNCWILLGILLVACGGRSPEGRRPSPQTTDRVAEAADELLHFWDGFPFDRVEDMDESVIAPAFEAYGQLLTRCDTVLTYRAVASLFQQAAVSRESMDLFAHLAETLWQDPNSSCRSDELFLPVLDALLASTYYSEAEKERFRFQRELISRNRVGHQANDFYYTMADGSQNHLYALQAEFLLMLFYNPGCPMCREVTMALQSSSLIDELTALGRMKVLALYPDEDLKEWHNHQPDIPQEWINAYDAETRILIDNVYNLTAIPSVYLLDASKTVLAKDETDIAKLEQVIREHLK